MPTLLRHFSGKLAFEFRPDEPIQNHPGVVTLAPLLYVFVQPFVIAWRFKTLAIQDFQCFWLGTAGNDDDGTARG
jgi:hypothetical protein